MLFSDIEGSTQLLARLGERYGDALSAQRSIMRTQIERWSGREMGTEGDSFFVIFEAASDAIGAALEAQRQLHAHAWPNGAAVRVRMGLHTGEPTRHEDGYVGMDVHRAARIASTAHGGQIVVSAATAEMVAGRLAGADLKDLGWHRLKDIPDPEHIMQLAADGLQHDFPALKSFGTRTNLPHSTTPIVGRDGELAELAELLADREVRLVTLTGPGGSGKTRLSIAAAGLSEASRGDGVYFVPLSAVTTADVMWSTIAEVLGIPGEGRAPPTFFEYIADKDCLLVLDNLEQMADAPQVVSELLAHAPGLFVLTTSRRPLHVSGEHEHPVPPLEIPSASDTDAQTALSWGAVALFTQRAKMVRPNFELTGENVHDVVEICLRLDGIPLAIELVAARIKLLSPHALLSRWDQSLGFSAAELERPDRQRTLRDTIAWSYDLLTDQQQAFCRRLGVFARGCDLDALAAVGAGQTDPLDEVAELVDVSLVTIRDVPGGEPRVGMLQTVRVFAREQLEASDEWDTTSRRHANHYLAVAEQLSSQLRGPQFLSARDRMELELDNLRAALQWALMRSEDAVARTEDEVAVGLRLCQELSWFWYACGYGNEGRRWLERAVECAADNETTELMSVLHGLGVLLDQQGQLVQAKVMLTRCLDFWRAADDVDRIAMELNSLAVVHRNLGDIDESRALLEEGIKLARSDSSHNKRLAALLVNQATLEVECGKPERGIDQLLEALEIDHEMGDSWGMAVDQINLAAARLAAGHAERAYDDLREVVDDTLSLNDVDLTIALIELLAIVLAELGDGRRSARLYGASETMRAQANLPRSDPDTAFMAPSLSKARAALKESAWTDQVEGGRSLSAEDAIAEATR